MQSDSTRWAMVVSGLTRLYIAFGFGLWALVAHFLQHAPLRSELQEDALGVASLLFGGIASVLQIYGAIVCTRAPAELGFRPLAVGYAILAVLWGAMTLVWQMPFAAGWKLDEFYACLSLTLALVLLAFLMLVVRRCSVHRADGRRGVVLLWWLSAAVSLAAFGTWIIGRQLGFTKAWLNAVNATLAGGVFLYSLLVVSVRRLVSATAERPA